MFLLSACPRGILHLGVELRHLRRDQRRWVRGDKNCEAWEGSDFERIMSFRMPLTSPRLFVVQKTLGAYGARTPFYPRSITHINRPCFTLAKQAKSQAHCLTSSNSNRLK